MNMTPEAVQEIVKEYANEVKQLQNCCERFVKADEEIQIWRGPSAEGIRNEMRSKVPAFDELLNVVTSYATTSQAAANRLVEVENQLTRMIG